MIECEKDYFIFFFSSAEKKKTRPRTYLQYHRLEEKSTFLPTYTEKKTMINLLGTYCFEKLMVSPIIGQIGESVAHGHLHSMKIAAVMQEKTCQSCPTNS